MTPFVLEVFTAAGGLAEGLRRAGLPVSLAVDWNADCCDSYERNLRERPLQLDATQFLRLVRAGWRPSQQIDFAAFDPPCAMWSRAGKRQGLADERDMLPTTCDLVAELAPTRWLICNIPGLEDSDHWPIAQRLIGGLSKRWCIDFAVLDAAAYGVPQHRVRPFWFGHPWGTPCIQWPERMHGECSTLALPGVRALRPYVTCADALGPKGANLTGEDLGVPVRLRYRTQHSPQHGSTAERPARTVGTTNLSDGNVLVSGSVSPKEIEAQKRRRAQPFRAVGASRSGAPAGVVTTRTNAGDGTVLIVNEKHPPTEADGLARTIGSRERSQAGSVLLVGDGHPVSESDSPANAITASDGGGAKADVVRWPWTRPATAITTEGRIPAPGHHDGSNLSQPDAVRLSEKACAILQGFPTDWVFCGNTKKARRQQIGEALPPPLAEAVGRSIVAQIERSSRPVAEVA